MSHRFFLVVLIFLLLFSSFETSEAEQRLIQYLLSDQDYNPLVRPTRYRNETVIVSFGLLLVQLIHVYDKEQIMKTNTWLHMKWYDYQLRWDPKRYGGIEKINIPVNYVWTPDVVLFNNADGNYEVSFKSKVVLMHTGEVKWIPPAFYKSSCRIDVKYFPFDTQECEMRFASWTYNAHEVTFTQYVEEYQENSELLPQQTYSAHDEEQQNDDYLESGTWDVLSIPSKFVHYRRNASSLSPDLIEVVFLIRIRRKALYYTVNIIVPTGLMSMLICIVFCLPTGAGEKMTLCMSVLLALNLFQLLLTRILPPTSAVVPLIAKYLLFTFTLNILVIVNTVIITNFYYRTPMTHSMPVWLRTIFLHRLPSLLGMASRGIDAKMIDDQPRPSYLTYIRNKRRTSTMFFKSMSSSTYLTRKGVGRPLSATSKYLRRDLCEALEDLRYIAAHYAYESFIESVRDEWKYISIVMDRLQFLLFSLVTLLGSLALLFQVPQLFETMKISSKDFERFSNPNITVNEQMRID